MDDLPDPNGGRADHDPPISTRSLHDSYEQRAPGLADLAFGYGTLHEAQGLEDDVLGDAGR